MLPVFTTSASRSVSNKSTLHHGVRVKAVVISRVDYGNVLLFGATSHELDRVQRLRNSATYFGLFHILEGTYYLITQGTSLATD